MPWDFRDVSIGIKKLRDFLLGRRYVFHQRFSPTMSPRSIPAPDIPRGPEYKYSAQYYLDRDVLDSVKPPVVAPIAEGCKIEASPLSAHATKGGHIQFPSELPTPGCVWWWDAHCYYKEVPRETPCGPPDTSVTTVSKSVCKQPTQDPCAPEPPKQDPCAPEPPKQDPCAPEPTRKRDPCAEVREKRKPAICASAEPPRKLQPCHVAKPEPPTLPDEPCDPCKPRKS